MTEEENIILFDSVCNFCNGIVQFIIKRDPKAIFKFTSLQSNAGKMLLHKYHIQSDLDSIVYIENGVGYKKSTAVLRICWMLRGPWKVFSIFRVVPTPIRDGIYDLIAKNRYKWFGKKETCMIPTKDIKDRFLD